MADFFGALGLGYAGERIALQRLALTLLELGCEYLSELQSFAIHEGLIAKAPFLELDLDDSIEDPFAVRRAGPGAPTSAQAAGQNCCHPDDTVAFPPPPPTMSITYPHSADLGAWFIRDSWRKQPTAPRFRHLCDNLDRHAAATTLRQLPGLA